MFDVHCSVYYSTNHIEITNKMQPCSRIYYSNVLLIAQHVLSDIPLSIRSSKTVIAFSGFTCGFGCLQLGWLSHRNGQQPTTYVKPEAAIALFELLVMGGVSLETC
jgi:hypothetical protein